MLTRNDVTLAEANIKAGSAIHVSLPLIGGVEATQAEANIKAESASHVSNLPLRGGVIAPKDEEIPPNTLRIVAVAKGNEDVILYREDFEVDLRMVIFRDVVSKFIRNMPEEHKMYHWFVHKIKGEDPKPELDMKTD